MSFQTETKRKYIQTKLAHAALQRKNELGGLSIRSVNSFISPVMEKGHGGGHIYKYEWNDDRSLRNIVLNRNDLGR